MKILQSKRFKTLLTHILNHIRQDSKTNADIFANSLYNKIKNLEHMPYKFRQSTAYNNPQIRDMIFKGFVIPYLIDKKTDTIIIMAIYKENTFNP